MSIPSALEGSSAHLHEEGPLSLGEIFVLMSEVASYEAKQSLAIGDRPAWADYEVLAAEHRVSAIREDRRLEWVLDRPGFAAGWA